MAQKRDYDTGLVEKQFQAAWKRGGNTQLKVVSEPLKHPAVAVAFRLHLKSEICNSKLLVARPLPM